MKHLLTAILILTSCSPNSAPCKCAEVKTDCESIQQSEEETYLCPYTDVSPRLRNITNPDLCRQITYGMCGGFDCWNYQWSQCLRCADYNSRRK